MVTTQAVSLAAGRSVIKNLNLNGFYIQQKSGSQYHIGVVCDNSSIESAQWDHMK